MKNERENLCTELIYEKDAYVTSFEASVTDAFRGEDGCILVELDKTAFFPEGGGQLADRGTLGGLAVEDVQRSEGRVLHKLVRLSDEESKSALEKLSAGASVKGEVDFELRFVRMQNHLAEHLFCGIANARFGYDNVGFHLTDVVTFDLSGPLSAAQVGEIETACNEVIWKNAPVSVLFPTPEEIQTLEFRSKLELEEGVRLVKIEGYDLCACCAPALKSTGEIGVIKVIDFMPHRGGTRITLVAGKSAWEDYLCVDAQMRQMMKLFSAGREHTAEFAAEYAAKTNLMHEENTALKKEVATLFTDKVMALTKSGKDKICFFMKDADEAQIRGVINACVKEYDGIIAGFRGNDRDGYRYVCGRRKENPGDSLRNLAARFKEAFGGSGGGSEIMIQGSAPAPEEKIRRFFDED